MATIADLMVKLGVDGSELNAGLSAAESRISGFSTSTKALVMGAGVVAGAALIGIGKHAFDMGVQFDAVLDTIQTTTGATGDELTALGESVTTVFTAIPTTLDQAGLAIGELAVRTGQTGKGLETLATQVLELSRITGTDLAGNIQAIAPMFEKWNVETTEQSAALDMMFRASQQTGVEVSTLATNLATFGAQLQTMGFDLVTSTALLASFEQSGINTGQAMMGLKTALSKMASEGVTDANQAFTELVGLIQAAPTDMEATAIAIDYFGQRAGPELATAIRAGKLDVDALVQAIGAGESTITGTAAATNDYAEKMQILKNQVNAALLPLGVSLFEALNKLMPAFTTLVEWVVKAVDAFTRMPAEVQAAVGILVAIGAALAVMLPILAPLVALIGPLVTGISALGAVLVANPIGLAILAIVAALALLYEAYQHNWFGFRDAVNSGVQAIVGFIKTLEAGFNAAKQTIMTALDLAAFYVTSFKGKVIERITSMKDTVLETIANLAGSVQAWFVAIRDYITTLITEAASAAWSKVNTMASNILMTLGNLAASAWGAALSIGSNIMNGIYDGIMGMWDAVVGLASDLANAVKDKLAGVLDIFSPSRATEYMGKMLGMGLVEGMEASERRVLAASGDMAAAALRPLSGSISASVDGMSSGHGGASTVNHYYALTADDLQRLLSDAQTGAGFARSFGKEVALYGGVS